MSRRPLVLTLVLVLLAALGGGLWWWRSTDGVRADVAAGAVADLDGVESAEVVDSRDTAGRLLRATMSPDADADQLAGALARACEAAEEELVTGIRIARGQVTVSQGARCGGLPDQARAAVAMDGRLPGAATVRDGLLVVDSGDGPPLEAATAAVRAVVDADVRVDQLDVEALQRSSVTGFVRLGPVGPEQADALEALAPVAARIGIVRLDQGRVEVVVDGPADGLAPVSRAAAQAAAALSAEPVTVVVEAGGLQLIGTDDPDDALGLVDAVADSDWQVSRIRTDLSVVVLDVADPGVRVDAGDLTGIDSTLRRHDPAPPADARIEVNDALGTLVAGTPEDLRRLAPRLEVLADQGYGVRWTRGGEGTGIRGDLLLSVTMPVGHRLADEDDLTAVVEVTRSIGWDGEAQVSLWEQNDDTAAASRQPPNATFDSTQTGPAAEVTMAGETEYEGTLVREAWDRTATGD